jgi:tetratricopeptide (TPR) repeat protein
VRLEEEPPDATFSHGKSGRSYSVYRRNADLWHREFISGGESDDIILGDHPMAWRIGSGHHSRSYLVDIDGYFFESPVTWYASKEFWAVSPGYDLPEHEGFNRATHEGCVHCHAGRVELIGESTHRLRLIEPSIGCESCHGSGSLHVTERTSGVPVPGNFDATIVHPGKLSRALNESICARCHLRGAGWSNVRGRTRYDFRPGLHWTDFQVDFIPRDSSGTMRVVGHFDQMRASRCYTESESLTCTTCHNPHESPGSDQKVQYYRGKCQQCHASADHACRLPESARLQQSPGNDCVTCHMPRSGTDIPHFSFTHHRIGLQHRTEFDEDDKVAAAELIPVGNISRLSALDLERCLGLAWVKYGDSLSSSGRSAAFGEALASLHRVYNAGMRDASVLGGLAYLHWMRRDPICVLFAQQALNAADCEPETRSNSLIVVGDMQLQLGNIREAKAAFEELTRLRLRYTDWQMLGVCRARESDRAGAISAFQKALQYRPEAIDIRMMLVHELKNDGQSELAATHRETAARLQQLRRHPPQSQE